LLKQVAPREGEGGSWVEEAIWDASLPFAAG
jgi:hypothetical protein